MKNVGEIIARIDQRLNTLQLSAHKASHDAGLGHDYIRGIKRQHQKGSNKFHSRLNQDRVAKLALVLKTTPEWLLDGHTVVRQHEFA